jgi:hypothetical protein
MRTQPRFPICAPVPPHSLTMEPPPAPHAPRSRSRGSIGGPRWIDARHQARPQTTCPAEGDPPRTRDSTIDRPFATVWSKNGLIPRPGGPVHSDRDVRGEANTAQICTLDASRRTLHGRATWPLASPMGPPGSDLGRCLFSSRSQIN